MLQTMRQPTTRLLGRLGHPSIPISRTFHKDYNAALEEQSFKLPDGRSIGFAEYGSLKGTPILNVGVVAGIGPPAVLTLKHAGLYTMAALSAVKWFPGVMRSLTKWYLRDDKRLQKSISRMSKYLTEEDRAEITGSDAESMIMAVLKAAYAQGPDGVIRDGQIYSSP